MTKLANIDYTVDALKTVAGIYDNNENVEYSLGVPPGEQPRVRDGVDFTNGETVPTRKILSSITPESLYSTLLWSMEILEGLYSNAILESVQIKNSSNNADTKDANWGIYVTFNFKAV